MMSAQSSYSSRSQQTSQMQMSQNEFKDMCRQLKIFPVVVSEETIDKVTLFCAAKRNGGTVPGQPDLAKQKSADGTAHTINSDYQTASDLNASGNSSAGSFEFGDFIRAFKVSILASQIHRTFVIKLMRFDAIDLIQDRLSRGQ